MSLTFVQFLVILLLALSGIMIVQWSSFRREDKMRQWELKKDSKKIISPLRMRAYERITLLLERTQPENLILNIENITTLSIPQLQSFLLRTIRLEFDHNISQQIYVSDELWDKVLQSRDDMAAFISSIAIQLPPDSTVLDYAQTLIKAYSSNGVTTHQQTIEFLKDEVRGLL